ncbi:hypothetical protein K7X08_001375 [Anisodus acutangulus]|uniref:Uncharacterized protein n=1 Tax=Anisodus acutangulus TaxID=402998 RepID=A0A9Q1MNT6_9SOLA|nr:hypothetical protein K7X08_001375 [Anisodus acutangulus]
MGTPKCEFLKQQSCRCEYLLPSDIADLRTKPFNGYADICSRNRKSPANLELSHTNTLFSELLFKYFM